MDPLKNINSFQLDVLKEIGNIGAGNAATALSKLLSKQVDMNVPRVQIVPFQQIAEFVGGEENLIVTVFLRIEGDIPGNMFFILNFEAAKQLVSEMIKIPIEHEEGDMFSEIELSALQEVGNILAGSYLTALSDLTKLNLQPSVPALAIDMAGAILSYGLIELGRSGDYALVIDTQIEPGHATNTQIEGHFFLLPDPESFKTLFTSLGV
ncbi:chemotaxis protein CheC [Desulfuribacillus alkaliarsenatis]|uniref:CheY-P-specific phosphatase CheC n=1 Tax=Desulfuribacillus alkaliarsenatis TaxID=766136 RepID=A0A1E5G5Z3_9FIRM|nr:chemotaxis protein CheC [Desulfuribacillus alkaliarsenatis]OEF98627.1 CheY-P-specific phosphatase CheC [Desulfuribacillus alkaliarsenatis]